jgi:hypothetical protein
MSARCPGEMNIGLVPARVRTAMPIVSPRWTRGAAEPFSAPRSRKRPASRVLPQPTVGRSSQSPRWQAMPMRRGCAVPMPSKRNTSGGCRSRSKASSSTGPSRKLRSPGT